MRRQAGGDDRHDTHQREHDHGHDHAQRGGPIGWLRHTFAHSHDASEKVDTALEGSERGIWAPLRSPCSDSE